MEKQPSVSGFLCQSGKDSVYEGRGLIGAVFLGKLHGLIYGHAHRHHVIVSDLIKGQPQYAELSTSHTPYAPSGGGHVYGLIKLRLP